MKTINNDIRISTRHLYNDQARPPEFKRLKIPHDVKVTYWVGRLTYTRDEHIEDTTVYRRRWEKVYDPNKSFTYHFGRKATEMSLSAKAFGSQKYPPQAIDGMLSLAVKSDIVRVWTWEDGDKQEVLAQSIRHIPRVAERKSLDKLAAALREDYKILKRWFKKKDAAEAEMRAAGWGGWVGFDDGIGFAETAGPAMQIITDTATRLGTFPALLETPGFGVPVLWCPRIVFDAWCYKKSVEEWTTAVEQGPEKVRVLAARGNTP